MQNSFKKELRYGVPAADQILFNRYYTIGYSYYFRQAKWALEVIGLNEGIKDRLNNFRPDFRIPDMFRADLADYTGSGYDRGHLVASADQREIELQNSETFLLSNMSPQMPDFNRKIWRELEEKVRELNSKPDIFETYVICGPVFYFNEPFKCIGTEDPNDTTIPVPHAYFKSVLTEDKKGELHMWSFILPNKASTQPITDYLVPTKLIEKLAGIQLWGSLFGPSIEEEKSKIRKMW